MLKNVFVVLVTCTIAVAAQERERAKIPDQFTWDLTKIYPSDDAWRQAKDALTAEIPSLAKFKGKLGSSAAQLADALDVSSRLSKELSRAYVYASMMSDQDTRVSKYQGMKQEMVQVAANFGAEAAFVEPEILKIEPATIAQFIAQEPRLKIYRLYVDDIQRRRAHTGTDVASVDLTYTAEEAQKHVLEALAPLGPEYAAGAKRAFTERWIDFSPNEGKRAGAYSNGGAYDVHPYMLLNYNGKYTDVSTLAHELGHTMQSYFSNKMQPYPTANYPIFVAEVASTFNEALLIDHMLKKITDNPTKLSLLGNYLENIKGTVFRQTQFAEFELRMHQSVEKGQPLTGEALDTLYGDITKKYYGQDKGICIVDDYIAHEWAFIPHFYRNFYVFQYATSFTASSALSEKALADPAATKRYLAFLGAGGSKYAIDLLKDAGIDMTTDEPLELTIKKMNRVMDEMEKLLGG